MLTAGTVFTSREAVPGNGTAGAKGPSAGERWAGLKSEGKPGKLGRESGSMA